MVWAHVEQHTGSTEKVSDANITFDLASTVPSGAVLLVWVAFDNLSLTTPAVSSISKQSGETNNWVLLASHDSSRTPAAGSTMGELWGIETTVTWSAATYTVTLDGTVTAKGVVVDEFSGGSLTHRSTAGEQAVGAGSVSVSTTGTAPASGDLVIGAADYEDNAALGDDTDTTNGSWTAGNKLNTTGGGAAANLTLIMQHKIATGSGHQTYDISSGDDGGGVIVALEPGVSGVSGTVSAVLPALASSLTGAVDVEGTATAVLPALASSLTGLVGDPVSGTADVVLPALGSTAAGTVTVTGTAAAVLPALEASAAGQVEVTGTVDGTLPALSASFSGTVAAGDITGTADVVLPALNVTASGEVEVTGTANAPLPALDADAAGAVTVTGTADALLPALDADATGVVEVTGTTDALLPALDVSLTGEVEISGVAGTVNAVLPTLSATAEGELGLAGTADAALPALAASAVGLLEVEGSLTATLPALGVTSIGAVTVEGTSVTVLPPLGASFDGTVTDVGVVGTADVVLPSLEAQASGVLGIEGTVSVTLPALGVVLSGVAGVLVPPVLPTYSFFPPTVDEHLDTDHSFRRRIHVPRGVSVIRDPSAGFVDKRVPLPEPGWIEGQDYFVGGYHYSGISEEIGLELIAAGYEPVLE
jgi:hypothetical protein